MLKKEGRERFSEEEEGSTKKTNGKNLRIQNQWRFFHWKEVFPGMFTIDSFLILIILFVIYEFSLDFESRLDARG